MDFSCSNSRGGCPAEPTAKTANLNYRNKEMARKGNSIFVYL